MDDDVIDLTTPPAKPRRPAAPAATVKEAVIAAFTPDAEEGDGTWSSADGDRGQKAGKRSLSLSPSFGVRLRSGSRKRRLSSAKKRGRKDVIDLCDSEDDEEVEADLPPTSVQADAVSDEEDVVEAGEEGEVEGAKGGAAVGGEVDNEEEEEEDTSSQLQELSRLKADELRGRLRSMGLAPGSRRKVDMAAALLRAMRAQRLASFPTQSTDRFSDRRGRCVSGRAVVADLPRGPNGWVLCRVCQVEVKPPLLTFCSKACVHEHRLRTSGTYVRQCLRVRDKGVCALCRLHTEPLYLEASKLCRMKGATGDDNGKLSMEEMQRRVDRVLAGTRLEGKVKLRRMRKGGRRVISRGLFWHADHIVAVCEGGGLQGLDNFRTLCIACHYEVTTDLRQRRGGNGKKKKAEEGAKGGSSSKGKGKQAAAAEEEEGEEEEGEESGDSVTSSQSSAAAVASWGATLGVIDEAGDSDSDDDGGGDDGAAAAEEEEEDDDSVVEVLSDG